MSDGNSIDREPISKFIAESVVIDLSTKYRIEEVFTYSDLGAYSKVINLTPSCFIQVPMNKY